MLCAPLLLGYCFQPLVSIWTNATEFASILGADKLRRSLPDPWVLAGSKLTATTSITSTPLGLWTFLDEPRAIFSSLPPHFPRNKQHPRLINRRLISRTQRRQPHTLVLWPIQRWHIPTTTGNLAYLLFRSNLQWSTSASSGP